MLHNKAAGWQAAEPRLQSGGAVANKRVSELKGQVERDGCARAKRRWVLGATPQLQWRRAVSWVTLCDGFSFCKAVASLCYILGGCSAHFFHQREPRLRTALISVVVPSVSFTPLLAWCLRL